MSTPVLTPKREGSATLILLIACAAQFMLILDDTIVNVALPTIGEDLRMAERDLSWVPNAYFLTFGGFLLIGGRMADRIGARRTFVWALLAFAVTSASCGAATGPEMLIASRAAQGISAALLSPAALALLLASHRDEAARTKALSVWASLIGLGAAAGLLAGGAISEAIGWRWIFLINLPISALTVVAALRSVPADDRSGSRAAPNVAGALLGTMALLLLVFTVVETDDAGWTSVRTLGSFAAVVGLGGLFVWSERRSTSPLLPPELLVRHQAMTANGIVFLAAASLMAMFFFLTLHMQRVMGWAPLETGAGFLPFSVGMGLAAAIAGTLDGAVPPRLSVGAGMVVAAGGLWSLSRLTPTSSYWDHLMPALVVCGVGVGTAFVIAMNIATGGADERDGGLASALLTTGQQVGGALGIAVMVTVATTHSEDLLRAGTPPVEAMSEGFSAAFTAMAGLMLASAVLAVALLRRPPAHGAASGADGTDRTLTSA